MSTRDDILAGLRIAEPGSVGDETPEDLLDRYRAEVEALVLGQTAELLDRANPDRGWEFSQGVDWAVAEIRRMSTEARNYRNGGQ
jgi:hypothetical protein